MTESLFYIPEMDCAAEERLVRMRLEGAEGVAHLRFDLPERQLVVVHAGDAEAVRASLQEMRLGAVELRHSVPADDRGREGTASDEQGPLREALAINAVFFVGEVTAGLLAGSMGLVADSLDMLADALVYALSLAAVGGNVLRKKQLARYSGYLQFGLAVFGLAEVTRRFLVAEGTPDVATMIVVAALALAGNVATLWLLSKARRGEAHVEASWIFTSNDIKVNALVIASAVVVWATGSGLPDLLAGAVIFLIVAGGARRILALSR